MTETGRKILFRPSIVCLDTPARDTWGRQVHQESENAVSWSYFDLIFMTAREIVPDETPINCLMDKARGILSFLVDNDVIVWQYRPERDIPDFLELTAMFLHMYGVPFDPHENDPSEDE